MTPPSLRQRLSIVRERVAEAALRRGRVPGRVTIIGVSKTADRPAIDEAYAAGLRHFGENRVQEALDKFGGELPDDLTLHLIGHLQTNKARPAVRLFGVIHSVDSVRLLDELQRQAERAGVLVPVLLEINISGEAAKHGATPEAAEGLVAHAYAQPNLLPRGLMTVAPLDDSEAVRPVFRALRELRDRLAEAHPEWSLPELSMGMTNDYPVAVEEGATLVRIGRAIFAGP